MAFMFYCRIFFAHATIWYMIAWWLLLCRQYLRSFNSYQVICSHCKSSNSINALYNSACLSGLHLQAYYNPNKDRPNLTVMVNAPVARVLTDKTASGKLAAVGVEFFVDSKPYIANARHEVIISAGYVPSHQIFLLWLISVTPRLYLEVLSRPHKFLSFLVLDAGMFWKGWTSLSRLIFLESVRMFKNTAWSAWVGVGSSVVMYNGIALLKAATDTTRMNRA